MEVDNLDELKETEMTEEEVEKFWDAIANLDLPDSLPLNYDEQDYGDEEDAFKSIEEIEEMIKNARPFSKEDIAAAVKILQDDIKI